MHTKADINRQRYSASDAACQGLAREFIWGERFPEPLATHHRRAGPAGMGLSRRDGLRRRPRRRTGLRRAQRADDLAALQHVRPEQPGSPSDPNHVFDRGYGDDPIGNRDQSKTGTYLNRAVGVIQKLRLTRLSTLGNPCH